MCTSLCYRKQDLYFGRNLDLEFSYNEQVVITPRNFRFDLRNGQTLRTRYAMIGMATVMNNYPLYYEASNEKGLCMAGLNFPGVAEYHDPREGADNIMPFEFIPWILGQAQSLQEVRALLERINLANIPFAPQVPLAPLHFMISDQQASIVVEPMADGLHIHENPYDVMTNNPPFDYHLWNTRNYRNLSAHNGSNQFSSQYDLNTYAVGMGAIGLPGDTSSASRFVRAAFNLTNSYSDDNEAANVSQVFHVLDSVSFVKGATYTEDNKMDLTRYSCCINADKGIFYYKTYDNSQITAIRMDHADLDSSNLTVYDLVTDQQIRYDN